MIYFDNATTSFPKPTCVYEEMSARFRELGVSPSRGCYARAVEMNKVVEAVRSSLARLFHAPSPASVVLTPSATFSLNQILLGLPEKRTRKVYVSPFEHNSVLRPLHKLGKSRQVDVRFLPFHGFEWDEAETCRQFAKEKPDVVVAMQASNVFGNVLPVGRIFAMAHAHGAVTVMDCAQSAGVLEVDVAALGADFMAFPGHKGLHGPSGIGGFVVNCDVPLDPIIVGGTGIKSEDAEPPEALPDRFESGSLNSLGILGLDLALRWVESTGVAALWAKKNDITRMMREVFLRYPEKVRMHYDERCDNVGVLSCTFASHTPAEMSHLLDCADIAVRTGLHCAPYAHRHMNTFPLGTVRFAPGYFTLPEDVAALDAAIRKL